MSYNYKKLLSEIPDETHAAKFLQRCGIIHSERFCGGIKMRQDERKDRGKLIPTWRCEHGSLEEYVGKREVFMVTVPNRTADVLLEVIREKIRKGSTIMLDCWSAYNMVIKERDGIIHKFIL